MKKYSFKRLIAVTKSFYIGMYRNTPIILWPFICLLSPLGIILGFVFLPE